MNPTKTKSQFKFRIFTEEKGEVKYLNLYDNGLGIQDRWTPASCNATQFDANNVAQLARIHNAKLEVI